MVHLDQGAGNRAADQRGDRDGEEELGENAGAVVDREPVREIQRDAGEEAGLGGAEQQAGAVEAVRSDDEGYPPGEGRLLRLI
ncbi:MAG: hypothetical protein ACRYG8_20910 [Janthinobacterium lividum]